MQNIFFLNFILLSLISCNEPSEVRSQTSEIKKVLGTWVNTKIDSIVELNIHSEDIFKPISDFTIKIDSMTLKYVITMHYGEQKSELSLDSLYIKDDSLLGGISNNTNKFIGTITKNSIISEFSLIDYSVYYNKNSSQSLPNPSFKKISDCAMDCLNEQFAIEKTLNLFPVKVIYNSQNLDLKSSRQNCDCNQKLIGLDGYTNYQIIDYYSDKSKNKIITLAFFNAKTSENNFFELVVGKQNILTRIK